MLFISLVPHAQVKDNSREEPTLRDAQKEAGGKQSGYILCEAHERANDPPCEGEGGKPESRRCQLEDDVTGDLEQDVADKPDAQCREVLASGLSRTMRVVSSADVEGNSLRLMSRARPMAIASPTTIG